MIYSTAALLILLHSGSTTVASEAKIVELNEHGFVFTIDGKTVAADDNPQTRFWVSKARALRDGFHAGDSVGVRLKTDISPAELRELADAPTWRWLDGIRKGAPGGVVTKVDAKWLTVKLDDGATFTYKLTTKSSAQIGGASMPLISLAVGTHVFVKGRLTSTLETTAAMVTDTKPPEEVKSGRKEKSTSLRLAPSGNLRGSFSVLHSAIRMFDLNFQDRLLHITYTKDTIFLRSGIRVDPAGIQKGCETQIYYRRDEYGRLIASKVELFGSIGS